MLTATSVNEGGGYVHGVAFVLTKLVKGVTYIIAVHERVSCWIQVSAIKLT